MSIHSPTCRAAIAGLVLGAVACGGSDHVQPLVVTSITIASPIGDRLAVGRHVTLAPTAYDQNNHVMSGATFSWNAAPVGVAGVDAAGVVTGLGAGNASISASSDGVSGQLALHVLNVDLNAITGLLSDPYAQALIANLTSTERGRVQAALDQCAAGVTAGDFRTIESCIAGARAEVSGAGDPTDRALLASLALYVDDVARLIAG